MLFIFISLRNSPLKSSRLAVDTGADVTEKRGLAGEGGGRTTERGRPRRGGWQGLLKILGGVVLTVVAAFFLTAVVESARYGVTFRVAVRSLFKYAVVSSVRYAVMVYDPYTTSHAPLAPADRRARACSPGASTSP